MVKLLENQKDVAICPDKQCCLCLKTQEGPFSVALGSRLAVGGAGRIVSRQGLICSEASVSL